ncbi:hypothetical protein [Lysobacter enzymogenes]|uniref:hypothetical protein n=1 Tax=Lysobacter enzymogenes TaxID=69 RepID=UPI00089AA05A|nr:hypothetical protein [Lysobacter enzymogenes]SDW94068.1 BssS protein family protein [Lysobacter enzymogenes]
MTDEIPLSPVAGWDLSSIPAMGAVMLTLHYLVSLMETPGQAHRSPNYVFHTAQLRELGEAMIRAADKAEAVGMSSPPGPKN